MDEEPQTHKVTKAEVVQMADGDFGIEFEFDDGSAMFAEVGSKENAEWYAQVQLGECLPIGMDPLLINAAKAETLRR
jgi:hypothetical protein